MTQPPYIRHVPQGWSLRAAKRLYDIQLGKMLQNSPSSNADVEVPYLKALHVRWQGVTTSDLPKMWASPSDLQKYSVEPGDLLVCEGGEVGRAAIIETGHGTTIIQNSLHRVRSRSGDTAFFKYVLEHLAHLGWFAVLCNRATIAHLTGDKLGAIRISVPRINAQRQIADFLDRKTAAIDLLIEKKERLIELLQEKRQALITQAVTKGLDPTVPMKDSGIEWLGEIPAHWQVGPLKRFASVSYGVGGELDHTAETGVPIISLPNVTIDGRLNLDELSLRPLTAAERADCLLQRGDLLFNWRNGSTKHIGKTAVFDATGEYTHVSFLLRIRLNERLADPGFFWLALNGLRGSGFFASSKFQVNVTYNRTELRRVPLPVPPKREQANIAAVVLQESERIDQIIDRLQSSSERLTEYRQALISAAVTGKIDVTEAS